jgi:ABC-type Mn2+/Zn2+ transport system ATPase subunit
VGYANQAVVADLTFTLERGRILSLVGANGSGKTTLLKTMASLLPPISGELRVLGAAPGALPARVAYLGQLHPSGFVLPLRAVDVVRMARFASLRLLGRVTRDDERKVERAMDVMGVAGLRNEPLDRLSGGQRQRVLIAQALARDAELLLLDEPGAGLDGAARASYRKVLREAASIMACSAVVATHDIEEAAHGDDVMLLAQRLVRFGSSKEVLTAEALLSTFGLVARDGRGGVEAFEHHHDDDCDVHGAPHPGEASR